MRPDDPYSRVDYRRLIAWPERIRREWPFFEQVLPAFPARLLDLGCGTGEHSRFLAEKGYEVVGIDSSDAMLQKAREGGPFPRVTFLDGDIVQVASLVEGVFDGAICLGNTLPHVRDRGALDNFFAGLRLHLRDGAPFLLQILNYEKVFSTGQRALPVNLREDADGEIVFLRLMTPREDGTVIFTPSTLRYRPGADPPLEVVATRNVELRGWRRAELEEALGSAGFRQRDLHGTVDAVPYNPLESPDLVIVAR